jgi:hypothetical protein
MRLRFGGMFAHAPCQRTSSLILLIVVGDAGSVLVHSHDRGIDHLHRRVMTGGQCVDDPVPYASLPPTNEAIIASGPRAKGFRQIAPGSTRA